jgi:uncharacterized protein YkwD
VRGKYWLIVGLLLPALLTACGSGSGERGDVRGGEHAARVDSTFNGLEQPATPTPTVLIPSQRTTPQTQGSAPGGATTAGAPYGAPPPLSALEQSLTQQLFQQINRDRAAHGLYPYVWNATLAAGARLHSWNMYHCGFSHTCPDGRAPCTRIADEGFQFSDCGENIGLAGPSQPPWANVYAVQESMANEPATGWHHIHLFSTTLHRVGVGVYVDPGGWVWFTEDFVS